MAIRIIMTCPIPSILDKSPIFLTFLSEVRVLPALNCNAAPTRVLAASSPTLFAAKRPILELVTTPTPHSPICLTPVKVFLANLGVYSFAMAAVLSAIIPADSRSDGLLICCPFNANSLLLITYINKSFFFMCNNVKHKLKKSPINIYKVCPAGY